ARGARLRYREVDPDVFGVGLGRSEEHTSELQSRSDLVCRLLLEKKKEVGQRERVGVADDEHERPPRVDLGGQQAEVGPVEPRLELSSRLFFFNDTATTEIYTLSLHDALPIFARGAPRIRRARARRSTPRALVYDRAEEHTSELQSRSDLVCRLLLEKKKQ